MQLDFGLLTYGEELFYGFEVFWAEVGEDLFEDAGFDLALDLGLLVHYYYVYLYDRQIIYIINA